MLAGMPSSFVACLMCSTAAPSDAPGARLNESSHHRELALVIDRDAAPECWWR